MYAWTMFAFAVTFFTDQIPNRTIRSAALPYPCGTRELLIMHPPRKTQKIACLPTSRKYGRVVAEGGSVPVDVHRRPVSVHCT